jgi:hypothetical protein
MMVSDITLKLNLLHFSTISVIFRGDEENRKII